MESDKLGREQHVYLTDCTGVSVMPCGRHVCLSINATDGKSFRLIVAREDVSRLITVLTRFAESAREE
jgi:hypothetical protein